MRQKTRRRTDRARRSDESTTRPSRRGLALAVITIALALTLGLAGVGGVATAASPASTGSVSGDCAGVGIYDGEPSVYVQPDNCVEEDA